MPSIETYVDLVKLILPELAKYFILLLLAVLSARLWRRHAKLTAATRRGNLILACGVTLLTAGTGYLSVCHSLSLMYWHFGLRAFQASQLEPAFSLFDSSCQYRKNADALGGKGVCLLLTGHGDPGISMIEAAKSMRKGRQTPFENFYEGLYYFYAKDPTNAIPLLEQASADPDYAWQVTKLFAVFQLDQNRPQEAARLMQPYENAQISEPDHAYIAASLKLAGGKTADARALVDKFLAGEAPPYWRKRLEQLRATIQNSPT